MTLTPITYSLGLFLASVKHGCDDHEPGGDCTLADAEEDPAGKQLAKGLRCRMTEQCNSPNEYIDTMRSTQQIVSLVMPAGNLRIASRT